MYSTNPEVLLHLGGPAGYCSQDVWWWPAALKEVMRLALQLATFHFPPLKTLSLNNAESPGIDAAPLYLPRHQLQSKGTRAARPWRRRGGRRWGRRHSWSRACKERLTLGKMHLWLLPLPSASAYAVLHLVKKAEAGLEKRLPLPVPISTFSVRVSRC